MIKDMQEERAIRKLTLNQWGYSAGPIRYPIMPDTGKGYLHSLAYASGLLPPNYPVPAIPLAIDWCPAADMVMVKRVIPGGFYCVMCWFTDPV